MLKTLFSAFILSTCIISTSPAFADGGKWFYWTWPIGHFKNMEFDRRYLEDGKSPHNRQWDQKTWTPEIWRSQMQDDVALIEGFYKHGILKDQTVKKGVPYLHVDWQFNNLSGYDKRRIVQTVDRVYGITNIETDDVFYIYDASTRDVIGMYSKYGLQLQ